MDAIFAGGIVGLGTTSGTRIVIGRWPRSPLGDFTDVMVQHPPESNEPRSALGRRELIAPSRAVADFVAATYTFDDVTLAPVCWRREGGRQVVRAGELEVVFSLGQRTWLGALLSCLPETLARRPWFAAAIDPVARVVMPGVRTTGSAGHGRTEYYAALDQHGVTAAAARYAGVDLGALAPVHPPVGFGFGSTPRTPSLVRIVSTVRQGDPPGR